MTDRFRELLTRVEAWFASAHADEWLSEFDIAALAELERRSPDDIFTEAAARPLVVALFGGTGVGKSSLLNRIAGQRIARVGEERPTSREVTLYVHESIELAKLPSELPTASIEIHRHRVDEFRDVCWIDAPDIDSTEPENRRNALAWLPHVDLVCYVVSPERYRDDVGWRELLRREHKHGWLFIMNRWDEGDPAQTEDFARLLHEAGFNAPLVLRTCCANGASAAEHDDFDRLRQFLRELLDAHGVRELSRLGLRARVQALQEVLNAAVPRLGDEGAWQKIQNHARERWLKCAATIREGLTWQFQAAAARCATRRGWLARAADRIRVELRGRATNQVPEPNSEPDELAAVIGSVFDSWCVAKLRTWIDAAELELRKTGVAPQVTRQRLETVAEAAPETVEAVILDQVRAALAQPGTALTRTLRRITGFLTAFLPSMAVLWIAWAVVRGYHTATTGETTFLGTPFAVHSALLVLIAWAVPYIADRALRPATDRIVLGALGAGLDAALTTLEQALTNALTSAARSAGEHRTRLKALQAEAANLWVQPIGAQADAINRIIAGSGKVRSDE